jgi:hypothetical protein
MKKAFAIIGSVCAQLDQHTQSRLAAIAASALESTEIVELARAAQVLSSLNALEQVQKESVCRHYKQLQQSELSVKDTFY